MEMRRILSATRRRLSAPSTGERRRWWVHVALLVTLVLALGSLIYLSRSITLHVIIGVLFMGLLVCHLVQRRRTVRSMAALLFLRRRRSSRSMKLALSDSVLGFLGVNVLVSGIVDGVAHRAIYLPWLPTLGLPPGLTRWHELSGLVLVVYGFVHVLRRRGRLRRSHIQ